MEKIKYYFENYENGKLKSFLLLDADGKVVTTLINRWVLDRSKMLDTEKTNLLFKQNAETARKYIKLVSQEIAYLFYRTYKQVGSFYFVEEKDLIEYSAEELDRIGKKAILNQKNSDRINYEKNIRTSNVISAQQASTILGVSTARIYTLLKEGRIGSRESGISYDKVMDYKNNRKAGRPIGSYKK